MKLTVQGSFREWLARVSPPPLKVTDRRSLKPEEVAQREMTSRAVIDPRRVNQFIDPEKEGQA